MWYETNLDYLKRELPKCERRINDKKQMIEDLQNELELLKQQEFNLLKNKVNYTTFLEGIMKSAQKGFYMLKDNKDKEGNKLDRRKKYNEIEIFNWFKETVGKVLGIEDIVITGMIDYNFGQGLFIEFEYLNKGWRLEVPLLSSMMLQKAYETYGNTCFKIALVYQESEHFWTLVDATFDEEELKEIMKKGIDKYCKV
jgi:hypothetical protein